MNESMDRVLVDWLREGPERGPLDGLERSLAATRRVGQRPGWTLPGRWIPVGLTGTTGRVQGPILAMVVLALLTLALVSAALFVAAQRQPPPLPAMWPQGTLDEVRAAQARADAGDPDVTWQVDPSWSIDLEPLIGTAISERFLREGLGWESFLPMSSTTYSEAGGPDVNAVVFIRCAPGGMNPLADRYPDMEPEYRACAPTLDDVRYETVWYTVGQPVRADPTGIWVVTEWKMLPPAEQAPPPPDADVTAVLQSFLDARVEGAGAEAFLLPGGDALGLPSQDGGGPLLYAATGGSRYERSEIRRVSGPQWPAGRIESTVRLVAEDGAVVEQHFVVVRRDDGRLGLVYGTASEDGDPPTIEDGRARYSLLDGGVTFAAAPTLDARLEGRTRMNLESGCRGTGFCSDNVIVVADPPVVTGCESGPVATDAAALARSIRSNPDLVASAPVVVSVGGRDGLQLDVVAAPGAAVCDPRLMLSGMALLPTDRMRLYLVDLPGGPARVLAIAAIARDPYDRVVVSQADFERVVETVATTVLESMEFQRP